MAKKKLNVKILILVVLASLTACSPAQRDWRSNTSIDVGAGGITTQLNDASTYVGMSYYYDYGFSASLGVWNDFYGSVGPYWGIGYSWVPFEK
jgi:hypothetical protein